MSELDERIETLERELLQVEEELRQLEAEWERGHDMFNSWDTYSNVAMRQHWLAYELHAVTRDKRREKGGTAG